MEKEGLQRAGDVKIEELKLICDNNQVIDLNEFLVEINLYEDIFSNFLKGNLVLTDSRNIIEKFNIKGQESLILKVRTPSFPQNATIEKTFTTFKITDRRIVRDNNTQNFTLHFVSSELYLDVMLPLFASFEGDISGIVEEIFQNYIATNRMFDVSVSQSEVKATEQISPLVIINEPANRVKFVSPGWSPFKCINWLASKSIPKETNGKNFLFFESNKSFYFGSLDYLFKDAYENQNIIGIYSIAASNLGDKNKSKDINREMRLAKEVEMIDNTDQIKNLTSGYLANRLIFLDVFSKEYQLIDYDHVAEYKKYNHTSGPGESAIPPFTDESFRNPAVNISFYPKNPRLFQDTTSSYFKENVNEKMDVIHGNRVSSLQDLTNIRMNITVPGRTDIEVGRMLYFLYPSLEPKSEQDKVEIKQDKKYSGYYLITAIHHTINRHEHTMTMEIVKDSLTINSNVTL